jgi:hypothetical protein
VFEKVVYKYIFNFLMENALIYKLQSGFLHGHSTTHTIRTNDKIWMTSEIRKEIRIRNRLREKYFKNKIDKYERIYKNQQNKVNNLKKSA